jgi:hypothetical protein
MNKKIFTLKRMLWAPPLLILFFGLGALNSYSHLGDNSLKYGFMFSISFVCVLFGFFLMFALLNTKRVVTLSDASIIVPKLSLMGFIYEEIPLASIKQLKLNKVGFTTVLMIYHINGKASLAKIACNSKKDFDEISSTLSNHLNNSVKKTNRTASHNIDKSVEEKLIIDAVLAVKNFIVEIGEKSKHPAIGWSTTVDLKKISEYMTFTENGKRHYVIFGELTDGQKVDYLGHATLLFIINDINILKMLAESKYKKNAPDISEDALYYRTRLTLYTCYLTHYIDAIEKHIALGEAINQENIQRIYQETQNSYVEHLQELVSKNDYLKKHIEEQINSGKLDNVPILPIAIGAILNDQTKQINNIYMTDELYEQALNWMASMQAQAMANR